jgi:hypothetical protein
LELVRATFHSILRRRALSETRSSTATDFQQCPVLWRCIHRQPKWRTGYSARDELVSSFSICKLFECKPTKLVSLPSNVTIRSNKTRCCPANYVCASPANSNGLIGCCPSGNTCGGTVNVRESTSTNDCGSQQPSESSTRRLLRNNNDERPRSPPSCPRKLRDNITSSRSSRLEGVWHWSDLSDCRTTFGSRENVQQDITARGGCFDEEAALISMMLRVTSTCRTRRSRRRIPFNRITLNCLSSHLPLHSSVH